MLRNLATTRENESVKLTNEQLDRQIIENVLNGDKNAYNLLVVKYQYKVLNVVGKYIYEPADREDIAQLFIIRPSAFRSSFTSMVSNLFRTHPSTESRIAYLEQF